MLLCVCRTHGQQDPWDSCTQSQRSVLMVLPFDIHNQQDTKTQHRTQIQLQGAKIPRDTWNTVLREPRPGKLTTKKEDNEQARTTAMPFTGDLKNWHLWSTEVLLANKRSFYDRGGEEEEGKTDGHRTKTSEKTRHKTSQPLTPKCSRFLGMNQLTPTPPIPCCPPPKHFCSLPQTYSTARSATNTEDWCLKAQIHYLAPVQPYKNYFLVVLRAPAQKGHCEG